MEHTCVHLEHNETRVQFSTHTHTCVHVEHTCVHLQHKHMQLKHTCVHMWGEHKYVSRNTACAIKAHMRAHVQHTHLHAQANISAHLKRIHTCVHLENNQFDNLVLSGHKRATAGKKACETSSTHNTPGLAKEKPCLSRTPFSVDGKRKLCKLRGCAHHFGTGKAASPNSCPGSVDRIQ